MRSSAFIAVGLGFVLMGAGLYALTLAKGKPLPAEPTKAQLRESKTFGPLMRGIGQALSGIRAPHREPVSDLPGYWAPEGQEK